MAILTIKVRNGPDGQSNPPDDTVTIQMRPSPPYGGAVRWIQNYRGTWKSSWVELWI